jgi:hypothetical protein
MHSFARFKKSRRKIAVAFTLQAGTAFSGSGGAGKPAPLSFHSKACRLCKSQQHPHYPPKSL